MIGIVVRNAQIRLLRQTGRDLFGAPRCGRFSCIAFECSIECRLGLVSDAGSDLRYCVSAITQHLCGKLEAPTGQILYRRLAQQEFEAIGKERSRGSDLPSEATYRPLMSRVTVH